MWGIIGGFRARGIGGSRVLIVCLGVVLLLGGAVVPAGADDANHRQYSVMYGGNYSDADAHRFSSLLYTFGGAGKQTWTGVTQSSYMSPPRDVAHWDLTNGYAAIDPWPGANQRDLMYLSTHGWPGQIRFYNPSRVGSNPDNADWTRRLDQNGNPDNIGPRLTDRSGSGATGWRAYEDNRWEIGSDYKPGSTRKTTSRWNDDLEWIVLAACDQLSSDGVQPGSRALFARTLLGDPRRAHSIMGYRASAPGDATDVGVVNKFFELAGQSGRTMRYAWLEANRSYPGSAQNAAMLLHNKHTYEGLPPVAPRESDSDVTDPADLRFWYLSSSGHATGPVAESVGERMLAGLKDLFGLSPAMAEEPARRMLGRNTMYRVVTEVPEGPGTMAPLLLTPNRTTPAAVASRVLGSVGVPESSPLEAMTRFRAGGRVALVGDDGSVTLQEDFEYGQETVSFDEASAVKQARSHVIEHDELPADARLTDVMRVNSTRIDPVTGGETDESTHAYIVEWRRDFDGVPVAGIEGDRVSAVVTADGVCQMQRNWRQVRGKGAAVEVIPGSKALETLAAEGERILSLPGAMDVTGMRLVYYSNRPGKGQSVMWPAWEIELTTPGDETANPVTVYVDARNGRMMTD